MCGTGVNGLVTARRHTVRAALNMPSTNRAHRHGDRGSCRDAQKQPSDTTLEFAVVDTEMSQYTLGTKKAAD
jgi:hypothetical protein